MTTVEYTPEEKVMMDALQAYVRSITYIPRGKWLDAHIEFKLLDDDIAVRRLVIFPRPDEEEPDLN